MQEVIAWLRRLIVDLDTRVFDEVRTNPTATIPGFLVASLAIFIAGLGGWLWWVVQDFGQSGDILVNSALIGSLLAIVLWVLWLLVVYVTLTTIFRERAYVEQLLRVMGLAASPLALMGFMFIPYVSLAIGLASLALTFGLTNIAIRSVTTANPARVLIANLLGFSLWCVALTLLSHVSQSSVTPHAPGIFLFNAVTSLAHDVIKNAVIT